MSWFRRKLYLLLSANTIESSIYRILLLFVVHHKILQNTCSKTSKIRIIRVIEIMFNVIIQVRPKFIIVIIIIWSRFYLLFFIVPFRACVSCMLLAVCFIFLLTDKGFKTCVRHSSDSCYSLYINSGYALLLLFISSAQSMVVFRHLTYYTSKFW